MARFERIVVTGADGFIGRHLCARLAAQDFEIRKITRQSSNQDLELALADADFVFHLAGTNRPKDVAEFKAGNADFTQTVCDAAAKSGRPMPLAYASSVQALLDNPYGISKRAAEDIIFDYDRRTGANVFVLRLPNVFGRLARPNYNSAIATFCYNIARGMPITVHDPATKMRLVYIDDVVEACMALLGPSPASGFVEVAPVHEATLGDIVGQIRASADGTAAAGPSIDSDFARALRTTYLGYLEDKDGETQPT